MINHYKTFSLFLVLTAILMGCTREKSSKMVNITIHAVGMKAAEVKLETVNILTLESSVLAGAKVDSTGAGFISFKLSRPLLGYISIGEEGAQVLLSPGYDLHVYVDQESPATPVRFAGKGAAANNYLAEVFLIQDRFERNGGKNYYELSPRAFLARLDSLTLTVADFHRRYTDSVALPKDISNLLESKTKLKVLSLKQNYVLSNFDEDEIADPGFPLALKDVAAEVPLDPTCLNSGMFEFAFSLHMYLDAKVYGPLASTTMPENTERAKDYFLTGADKIINQGGYPSGIREFFIAKNIYRSMSNTGITPGVNAVLADFKKRFATSSYLPALEKMFNQWLAISAGKAAPGITGITPDGKTLNLSDLKGKIVYIDVWATWCSPCLKEIPYARKIAKHFEKNKQVAFLYVSVDQDQQAWKIMLAADKEFKGIHILEQPKGKTASVMDAYLINGIPRYMLIDQQGNIVQVDAPRPSSGKVIGQIEEMLKKEKVAIL